MKHYFNNFNCSLLCSQHFAMKFKLNLKKFGGDKDRPAFFCVPFHIYLPNFIIDAIEWMNSILIAYNTVMCMPTLKSSPRQSCLLMSHVVCIYPMCSYAKETFILRSPDVCRDRHILQLFKCLFELSLYFSILQITGKCFPACWSTVCPFYPILLTGCLYIPGDQSVL